MMGLDALMGGNDSSKIEQPDDARGQTVDELGSEDFLQLMIAQFQNQDPFEPMESGEMMGQMAHFSTANGVSELQGSFERFADDMNKDQALRAASLVGRNVLVNSDTMPLGEEGLSGLAQVPRNTESLNITIQDSAGQTVHEMALGRQNEGEVPFHWDGLDDSGQQLPPGNYRVRAEIGSGESSTAVDTLASAPVNSVSLEGDGRSPKLSLEGAGEFDLDSVRHIQ
ncbi:flagellar hook assembly protein FlgD [Aquisalimonas sp. 2447]|uniref:flagellar hook assembly protein FlgD n=1 Tax=Aquisalimonas sp. 2447 TaxID=2740807 RepID=UPI0014327E73|nr:flagellar hook assembly protein FlgD [Aquisalimonas sp. 2447]QIT56174.1 flagellar hook assembly protein FlgD [Aquisalimonas sp. 2447]